MKLKKLNKKKLTGTTMANNKHLLLLFCLFSVQPLLSQEDNRSTDQVLQDLKKELSSGSPSTDKLNTPIQFDESTENYQRFRNSPCFEQLGFVKGRDNEALYKSCEERLRQDQRKVSNVSKPTIFIFFALIIGLVVGAFALFNTFSSKDE